MKPSLRFASLLLVASATAVFFSGCYTQLATREDDEDRYERNGAARVVEQEDSTADKTPSYYDDYDGWRSHSRIGFSYYYPSWWYWDAAFSDPYFYGWPNYGYPYFIDGFGRNYYGYGPYGYGGYYGYYGYYDPYGYYGGYPYIVYGANTPYQEQTRNSGYRRTGDGRYSGSSGRPSSTLGIAPASRRGGYQVPASSGPATRRAESPSARGSSRSYTPQSSGSSGGSAAPSRSGSPSVRSAPSSGGSRSPEGGTRSSGTNRNRGTADAPMSGYYRPYVAPQATGSNAVAPASSYYRPSAGAQRSGSSSYTPPSGYYRSDGGSQRSSTPSYSPPASSPAPSYSPPPASSAPSSGGGDGGSRSSGASRSGRN